jgi:hypothetical protein
LRSSSTSSTWGPGFSAIGAAIQFTKMDRAEHGALSRTACPETHTISDPGRDTIGGSGLPAVHRRGDISGLSVADITFVQALNHAVWQADSELMLCGPAATAVRAGRRAATRTRLFGVRVRLFGT